MGVFTNMERDIEANTPKEGFNLCGIDDFELPGEQLYVLSHHASREEAKAAQAKLPTGAKSMILPE